MEETKKVFGASMMEPTDELNDSEIPSPFSELGIDESETEGLRDELKASDHSQKVVDQVSTDAITGTKISTRLEEIEKKLDDENPKGKSLPDLAVKLVKDMTGVELDTNDCERIAKFFEDNAETLHESSGKGFDGFDTETIGSVLGEDIKKLIKATTHDAITGIDDTEEYEQIIRRLFGQIYASYNSAVEYNDDAKELAQIIKKIKDTTEAGRELTDKDQKLENLTDMHEWISQYVEARKKLDDRNRRLRADYSIDDADTRLVSEVKEALEDALTMKSIGKYVETNKQRLVSEARNASERITCIKNWITDLKNDPETLYTFPTNDFYSIKDTIMNVREFISNALLAEEYKDKEVPEDYIGNIDAYYVESGICDKNTINAFNLQAELILYILAKTFKPKRTIDIYYRRVLSYTLDMMGKLANEKYRKLFHGLGNYLYKILSKG